MLPLVGLGCGDPGPSVSSECTALNDGEWSLSTPEQIFGSTQAIASLNGNVRSFTWTAPLLSDLCVAAPESQNIVNFQFSYANGAPETLTAQGKVFTSIVFQPYSTSVVRAGPIFYHGTVKDIGLVQGSLDGMHAVVSIELQLSFPTLGSLAADQAAIRSWVTEITIGWQFQTLTP